MATDRDLNDALRWLERSRDSKSPSVARYNARVLLDHIDELERELARQQEIWSMQSLVIRALAAEVPDEIRTKVLGPLRSDTPFGAPAIEEIP